MNRSDGHFDEMTGLLYLEGQLDAGHASEVSAHLGVVRCLQRTSARAGDGRRLAATRLSTVDDESIPASVVAAPERGAAHWGWIAAFGLGARRRLHTLERLCRAVAGAGFERWFHAGKSSDHALFYRRFLERMGCDAKLNGIHGGGHAWDGCNLAAEKAAAAFHGDCVRGGSARLCADDSSAGGGRGHGARRSRPTRCRPGRR